MNAATDYNKSTNLTYIYDGVLHDTIFHINGFKQGFYFVNLDCTFDQDSSWHLQSCGTTCHEVIRGVQSTITFKMFTVNLCYRGLAFESSIVSYTASNWCSIQNCHIYGLEVTDTKIMLNPVATESKHILNIWHCLAGIKMWSGSSLYNAGLHCGYNYNGVSAQNSFLNFTNLYNSSTIVASIHHSESNGVFLVGCVCDPTYLKSEHNKTGIYAVASTCVCKNNRVDSIFLNNNDDYGIVLLKGSYGYLYGMHTENNGDDGILVASLSTAYLQNCVTSNNGRYGIRLYANSSVYGYYPSGYTLDNNSTRDVNVTENSNATIYCNNSIVSNPSTNNSPSYSNASGGTYVLFTSI
jgi:hypothetical protein